MEFHKIEEKMFSTNMSLELYNRLDKFIDMKKKEKVKINKKMIIENLLKDFLDKQETKEI